MLSLPGYAAVAGHARMLTVRFQPEPATIPRVTRKLDDARGGGVEGAPFDRESQRVEARERPEHGRPLIHAATKRAHHRGHATSGVVALDDGLPEQWLRPDLEEDIVTF